MITRKENLLIRPFQHRKYIEHRQKVITALPRIDDVTPPQRNHVHIKRKKLQHEAEKHARIERDNFILLCHLSDIMKMKRVDNYWLYEHPKFLRRIKLFQHSSQVSIENEAESIEFPKSASKKERCIACHPENYVQKQIIPEERVPWEMKPGRDFHSVDSIKKHKKKILPKEINKYTFNPNHVKSSQYPNRTNNETFQFPDPRTPPKQRGSSAPSLGRSYQYPSEGKIPKEKSLTVIIRFPPKAQVILNAGITESVDE